LTHYRGGGAHFHCLDGFLGGLFLADAREKVFSLFVSGAKENPFLVRSFASWREG